MGPRYAQLYLSAAPLYAVTDQRIGDDPIGVRGGWGYRAGVGLHYLFALGSSGDDDDDYDGDDNLGRHPEQLFKVLLILIPELVEVDYEHTAGSRRWGVSFGWGY